MPAFKAICSDQHLRPSQEEIACCARELWLKAGRPAGRDLALWLAAERSLCTSPPGFEATNLTLHALGQPHPDAKPLAR